MEEYSGRVLVRMPIALHSRLSDLAKQHGVSLNQYIIFLLSINESRASFNGPFEKEDVKEQFSKVREWTKMGQNTESGRLGNETGRFIGKEIAEHLGIITESGSNKGKFNGRNVVIKSARIGNTLYGITNKMVAEIDDVIIAKEVQKGRFDLYIVNFDKIKDRGSSSSSSGNKGRVTNYRINDAVNHGHKFDSINIEFPL